VVIVLMGAAGAGKTTIGRALAADLGWPFVEGDEHHPPANIAKMRAGVALTDADRAPWLADLHAVIARTLDRREHRVLACSALTHEYRDILRGSCRPVRFVHLKAPETELRHRLSSRPGHFAGPTLLRSQLAALEEPTIAEPAAIIVDGTAPPQEILASIRRDFGL